MSGGIVIRRKFPWSAFLWLSILCRWQLHARRQLLILSREMGWNSVLGWRTSRAYTFYCVAVDLEFWTKLSSTWKDVFLTERMVNWHRLVILKFVIKAIACRLTQVLRLIRQFGRLLFCSAKFLPICGITPRSVRPWCRWKSLSASACIIVGINTCVCLWNLIQSTLSLWQSPLCHFLRSIVFLNESTSNALLLNNCLLSLKFFRSIIRQVMFCVIFLLYVWLFRLVLSIWTSIGWNSLAVYVYRWFRHEWFTLSCSVACWFCAMDNSLILTVVV